MFLFAETGVGVLSLEASSLSTCVTRKASLVHFFFLSPLRLTPGPNVMYKFSIKAVCFPSADRFSCSSLAPSAFSGMSPPPTAKL